MEREISAAMPQRCGALMALVTRFHSNAFVERQHVLEEHSMRIRESRYGSRITRFAGILLAILLATTGCAPRITSTVDVPQGNTMAEDIQNGTTPYKGIVPTFVLDGKSPYIMNIQATFKVTDVIDTRTVRADTTTLVTFTGQTSKKQLSVVFYLCEPLSDKADRSPDGTMTYSSAIPQKDVPTPTIIKGQTYTVTGILQPHWQGIPLIYLPSAFCFVQDTANESFFYGPSDQFEQEPSSIAARKVIEEYFKYWNEKNLAELEKRMTPNRKGRIWGFDTTDYVKLIAINERHSQEAPGTKAFNVVFEIKNKKGKSNPSMEQGTIHWSYLLKRDNANSPWLIYDWGGGSYDW